MMERGLYLIHMGCTKKKPHPLVRGRVFMGY
jgi:hypothetical protein